VAQIVANLDLVLLAAVVALVGYGLWIVDTVTEVDGGGLAARQGVAVALGTMAAVAIVWAGAEILGRLRWLLYGATVLLLVVVVASPAIRGSSRWIDLGFFQLQPSEPGKIALAVVLAWLLASRAREGALSGSAALVALGATAVPAVLVFAQPDFGTSLVFAVTLGAALFFAGASWGVLTAFGSAAASLSVTVLWILPANGVQVLRPYQLDRLVGFIDPDADPSGATYNVNQSVTAVGAGGLTGRGSDATQTGLSFLPEHQTDFIFSALAEQRGFAGAALLLALLAIVVWRGIRIVAIAPSLFQATLAGSLVAAFTFQVVVNTGMTMGIAPVVGIPLPFVSYGGSSMVASLVVVGILQAIHVRGRLTPAR
jgi:rod shape determining protein RodA